MKQKSNTRKKIIYAIAGVVTVLIICGIVGIALLNHTVQIRSDSAGVTFEMDDDRITCVSIKGQFPYLRVTCPFEEDFVQDAEGNVIETIRTYTMEAEPFVIGKSVLSMNLNIEASNGMTYTYILKFADKDVTIVNGKVVE